MKYIKQLDSVRAIAVIFVIISHWISEKSIINILPNGEIGVDIFFVLSGFLISAILFDSRIKAEALKISKFTVLKNFYIRRTLRIFPIYYLTIFFLLIFSTASASNIRGAFFYFFTYTSNIYFFKIKVWDGVLSHLWSLAVEEQFYIIWPWLMLFVKKEWIIYVIALFILTGLSTQYILRHVQMVNILTFTCFDAFGFGGLLAWILIYKKEYLKNFYFFSRVLGILALIIFGFSVFEKHTYNLPVRFFVSIIALSLITYIVINSDRNTLKFKFILNNKILIFLGTISYGIYLYHNILPRMLNIKFINKFLNPLLPDYLFKNNWWPLYISENAALLILTSWLSYIIIEKRFLRLKKSFNYQNNNGTQQLKNC